MLFHAMMEFCLDLLRSKFWLIGEWSIDEQWELSVLTLSYSNVTLLLANQRSEFTHVT